MWRTPLKRFAHAIMLAEGWRGAAIAFVAGALSTFALAPFNAWPVLLLTFPVLVWLIDGAAAGPRGGVWAAAGIGWWFGFGYFLAGLYWVGHAFLVDAKTFGWLLPIAVAGLPAGLALFMGQHVVEYGLLMAGSLLALVPVVLFFLLIQRSFVAGIATTGLK